MCRNVGNYCRVEHCHISGVSGSTSYYVVMDCGGVISHNKVGCNC